ncbi:MAG: sugar ABC transporter permease [Planctomycetes bacterium]|nr:sugar ABC transporter permease [Planctomycetota bacterium]
MPTERAEGTGLARGRGPACGGAGGPRRLLRACVRRHWHFYLFISPFFILFAVFGLYPLLFSLYLGFVKWDGLTEQTWVGLGNFAAMLEDDILAASLWNTLVIGLLYAPLMLALAFLFALALNQPWLRLRGLFRSAFFLPCVTPMVVIAIVFGLLYSPERGLLNYVLAGAGRALPFLGLKPVPWITSEEWSKAAVAVLVTWRWTGYNMVLMLAGLQGIPHEYYEAAKVDGAGPLARVRHITVPLMRPTFLFCGLLSLLGTVYMFDEVFVLTRGGPGISSTNFGLYLFNISFSDFRFGYASSVAYTVALGVFAAAMLVTRRSRLGGGAGEGSS